MSVKQESFFAVGHSIYDARAVWCDMRGNVYNIEVDDFPSFFPEFRLCCTTVETH